jgi:hypothetical protein
MVDAARAAGARIVAGGKQLDINGGFFYAPTVIADVDDKAQCVKEEVFGPVLTVQPFDSDECARRTRAGASLMPASICRNKPGFNRKLSGSMSRWPELRIHTPVSSAIR